MEKIKVKFKKNSPYSEYGYYRVGDIGTVVGYTQGCAVILMEDGSFVKAELNWIKEDINSIPENPVNEDEKIKKELKAYIGLLCDGLFPQKKDWLAWIEKQGKQKPDDNVEPKFHEDEWVVTDKNNVVHIKEIENGKYLLENTMSFTVDYVDKCWRKWTIQDAKDGDILCTYEYDEPKIVFILRGTPKIHYALSYHCYYNVMYPHFASDYEKGCLAPNDEDVKPATKEQRDLLFQKMYEAGYGWDAEKKELKKIEQKPAWSEEDEKMYTATIFTLAGFMGNEDKLDWIKSLKDKIQPKPKQEWSEEDIVAIDCAVEVLSKDLPSLAASIERLKSLKPQNTWKPSDEQMDALLWIIENTPKSVDINILLNSLYEQLKAL